MYHKGSELPASLRDSSPLVGVAEMQEQSGYNLTPNPFPVLVGIAWQAQVVMGGAKGRSETSIDREGVGVKTLDSIDKFILLMINFYPTSQ